MKSGLEGMIGVRVRVEGLWVVAKDKAVSLVRAVPTPGPPGRLICEVPPCSPPLQTVTGLQSGLGSGPPSR